MREPLWIVRLSRAALALLFVAWAPAGVAQVTATLTAGVHLRAGPDIVYPSLVILPPARRCRSSAVSKPTTGATYR
jgi:uncharacterized protein YraI